MQDIFFVFNNTVITINKVNVKNILDCKWKNTRKLETIFFAQKRLTL